MRRYDIYSGRIRYLAATTPLPLRFTLPLLKSYMNGHLQIPRRPSSRSNVILDALYSPHDEKALPSAYLTLLAHVDKVALPPFVDLSYQRSI